MRTMHASRAASLAALAALTALLDLQGAPLHGYIIESCRYVNKWSSQTSLVADIRPGAEDAATVVFGFSSPGELMAEFQGDLLFAADDGTSGSELWHLVAGAPALAADLAPGAAGSAPHAFAHFQNQLYFAASTAATGEELFRWNGTTASLAAETVAGSAGAELRGLTVWKNALYFTRSNAEGTKVWRFDGSTAQPVAAINQACGGNVPSGALDGRPFVAFGNRLYFVAKTALPDRYELWSYDGNVAAKIQSLSHGDDITERAFELAAYKNALYYGALGQQGPDEWDVVDELWRYPGSGSPAKIATLSSSLAYSFSQPASFEIYRQKLYFESHGRLWSYDGSALTDLSALAPDTPSGLTYYAKPDRVIFSGSAGPWSDEPYVLDDAGTQLLANIMPDGADPYPGSFPTRGVEVAGTYYFLADDDTHGRELWKAKGDSFDVLHCDIVVAPIWVDKRLWVIDELQAIVVVWQLAPEGEARLVSRDSVRLIRNREQRLRGLDFDTRKGPQPESFALATMVFDARSGEVLDRQTEIVGMPAAALRQRLERRAAAFLARTSYKEAQAQRLAAE